MERIVVLANSRKCFGYCLAGKAVDEFGAVGGWLRPVTDTVQNGLPPARMRYRDGQQVSVLDVVTQRWGAAVPTLHQKENRLLGPSALERCGRVAWGDLPELADDGSNGLWIDGYSSSKGTNDRVPSLFLPHLPGSLQLVAVHAVVLYASFGYEGKTKHRAAFRLGARHYDLALTDTVAIDWLGNGARLSLNDAYVCVSLAVPFSDGYAYKLATAIITEARAGR